MEPDKKSTSDAENKPAGDEFKAPADALSRTPDELAEEKVKQKAESNTGPDLPEQKISPIKRFFRKVNVYLLIFVLLVIVAGAFTIVNYLNSQKAPVEPGIDNQSLSSDALKQLANTDASVGATSQTLTIQGNAVIAGQTLMRGNLNVAGNFQTGGSIQAPSVTISGAANLGEAQINSLQVATNTAVQGTTTLRDLNVSGATSLSGPVTASQITVTRLILSGNALLQVPGHISFTGPSPSRTVNSNVVGNGGSVSISGSDTAGLININTGNNPTAGCFTRVTFQQAFTGQPRVIIGPVGQAAGQTQYYVDRDKTGFNVCSANVPPANQVFSFDYFVTN